MTAKAEPEILDIEARELRVFDVLDESGHFIDRISFFVFDGVVQKPICVRLGRAVQHDDGLWGIGAAGEGYEDYREYDPTDRLRVTRGMLPQIHE